MNKKQYITLFTSTFSLSAFTFGGGYVIVPLMRDRFVNQLKWIEEDEMLDLIAIAQSSPGPIAVNASIIIGYKLFGIKGAILALIGTVTPPLIIISIISMFYVAFRDNIIVQKVLKGMQAGVAAIIASVIITLVKDIIKLRKVYYIFMMIAAFIATYFFKVNVVYIILICGILGAVITYFNKDKEVS